MEKRSLAAVGLALGLGLACGSSGPERSNAAVDPAAQDFCLQWANGVCRLAYQCVDAAAQDAAFHARYGTSLDNCWQSVETFCTQNQSGSQTFGPSCGPGKQVNSALADACTFSLESFTCPAWTVAPAGACDTVCSAPISAGGAGSSSGGGGGMSAGGSGTAGTGLGSGGSNASPGAVATPADFCATVGTALCDRIFECDAAAGSAAFGTLAGCKAGAVADCGAVTCPGGYDAAKAAACVVATKTATCQQLTGNAPEVCQTACQ